MTTPLLLSPAVKPPTVEAALTECSGILRGVAAKYSTFGAPVEDLLQEGRLGVVQAYGAFDPDKGAAFPSYAYFYIREAVQAYAIRFGKVVTIPDYAGRKDIAAYQVAVLDEVLEQTEQAALSTEWLGPWLTAEEHRVLSEEVERLSEVQRVVVKARYGLGPWEPQTLAAIGEGIHLSIERVRQIEVEALRELRARIGEAS